MFIPCAESVATVIALSDIQYALSPQGPYDSLGISVAGGVGSPHGNVPLFIATMDTNGLAAKTQLLQVRSVHMMYSIAAGVCVCVFRTLWTQGSDIRDLISLGLNIFLDILKWDCMTDLVCGSAEIFVPLFTLFKDAINIQQ